MGYRVHVGYTPNGASKWKRFASLDRAQAFAGRIFKRSGIVVAIEQDRGKVGKVKRNPALLTYGNPGREMGTDVLAVLYRHKEDGAFYCHGFGDADIKLASRGDSVTIRGLKSRTGVKLMCQSDGSLRLVKKGSHLWEDM